MKQGNLYTALVMGLLAIGLGCYFAFYLVDALYNPFSTTVTYLYTMDNSVEVEGVIVRDELVLAEQTGIVESSRREGERVGAGRVVALVHRDAEAQADQAALNQVENEIAVIQAVLGADLDVLSAARQDEAILQSIVEIRGGASAQSLSSLDDMVVSLKSQVLQRDYAYSGELSQTTLTLRLNELVTQQKSLASLTGSATQSVYAPVSGLYSANVDGYESIFRVDGLSALTEATFQANLQQGGETVGNVAGKLILGSGWYLALSVPQEAMASLRVGDKLTVRFGGEFAREITMNVTQMGDETEGNRLLVLYSDEYASDITLIRQTSVELIYDSNTGLRIPKESLRMQVKTDSEGNETQTLGVYTVVAGKAEFHAVTVLVEGQDFYVVTAFGTQGATLRPGDEVVVYATDLYDGKQLN